MIDFREITEFLKDAIGYIITLVILVVIFVFVIAIVPVAGNSMNPAICDGDFTIVIRFIYEVSDIKRGDIVNIKTEEKLRYVKRIIGLPGENVSYHNEKLLINGKVTKEPYLSENAYTHNFEFEDICSIEDCPDGVIPDDMYLVLGDNRDDSFDSRDPEIGLISKKEVKGKVVLRIWPLNEWSVIK